MPAPTLFIACLCAQWCGTCRDYQALFARLHEEWPSATLRWVDVEDLAHWVEPVEVDNFPTLLIAVNGQPHFFGTLTPHWETLRRLVQSSQNQTQGDITPEVVALTQRLSRHSADIPSPSSEG